jgi:prepilin-type processing-associated H-X9-DG protein
MIVIGIIAILAAILLPVLSSARASGYKVTCISNVHQLLQASAMYVSDWDRRLVPARVYTGGPDLGTTWCVLLRKYTGDERLLLCPVDLNPQVVSNSTDLPHGYGINYDLTYVSGASYLSWSMAAVPRTADLVLFFDMVDSAQAMGASYELSRVGRLATRHSDRAVVGFLDGHARAVQTSDVDSDHYWDPSAP